MGRDGKVGRSSNFKKRVRSKHEGSDDSDEDYVASEEGNEESDDDDECFSLNECASEEGFQSFHEEDEGGEEEVRTPIRLKREWGSSVRERKIVDRKSVKRKQVSDEEEEDKDKDCEQDGEEAEDDAEDYCSWLNECALEEDFRSFHEEDAGEEEEVRRVVRLKSEQVSSVRERMVVDRKPVKRKRVSDKEEKDKDYEQDEEDEEEEVEDDDEEFSPDEEDCFDEEFSPDDEEDCLDEEFTPDDEEDCLDEDEEEELTVKKKKNNTKVSKRGLRKKNPSKHRTKRRKSAVPKKPLRNQERKKHPLKRKRRAEEDDNDDCGFIDNTRAPRKKSRVNAGRRKKAYVVPSDSDFVSSGSSDYEYTISEENTELVKESSQFFGSLKTSLRSSSSSKRAQEFEETGHPKKPLGVKGKERVEETKAKVIKPVCGICLTEENKRRLRGTLNCCSHYFCFTCIMEWSKVESRCPLCKQRFETINKPARSAAGVDSKEVVIQVPKRDQVYQPSEEELRSYLDPYENVICSECHQGGDDELMLLCDICDSSAHTYCVGLNREVPDGNWYCDGCRPVAIGSSSSQVQDCFPDQRTINNSYNRFSPIVNVRESLDSAVSPSPRMPSTPSFVGCPSPRFPSVDIPVGSPAPGVGAPTLTGRRWLHRHIQNLRSMNRMNFLAGRSDGISTTNMGTDLVNSLTDQNRETTVKQARSQDTGIQHPAVFEERLQNDPSSSLPIMDLSSSRLDNLRGQAVQDSTSLASNTLVNLILWPELAGISSNDQLRQCSNGPNIGPESCSPFPVRDEDNFSMAKEQLQPMVRSHLRALSNNIDLDNGTVKDITTSATHTLLAACGLEHIRSEVHIVPPPSNCTHIQRAAGEQASLMKGCCLTCFDSFVKDVVKRIMDTRSPQWLSLVAFFSRPLRHLRRPQPDVSPQSFFLPSASPPLPSLASAVENGVVWDSAYFVRIAQCGYEYEQFYAFLPLLPACIFAFSRTVFMPLVPLIGYRAVLALSGYVVCNVAFIFAAVYFYKLSVVILKDTNLALQASVLFCFNPASIFYSSIYSESLHALLSVGGCYYLISGSNNIAVLWLALSSFARSNGVLNAGYVGFQTMHQAYDAFSRKRRPFSALWILMRGALCCIVVFVPFIAFLAYGYYNMCLGRSSDEMRPWCKARIPLLYNYIQSHYWGVGFLRYFQFKQLPNFLLASPILSLAVCSIIYYVTSRPEMVRSLGF